MSLKLTTTLPLRHPTLLRVWRTTGLPGAPLTSSWLPSALPTERPSADRSTRP